MISNVVERYRQIFGDVYTFCSVINKPTLTTIIDRKDPFWNEYDEKKISLIWEQKKCSMAAECA